MKLGEATAVVLTRQGERVLVPLESPHDHEGYIRVCCEFADFAFTPAREREQREMARTEQELQVGAELGRIQRTLGILSGRVPGLEGDVMGPEMEMGEASSPEVSEMLQKNAEQLNSIKKLLSSL